MEEEVVLREGANVVIIDPFIWERHDRIAPTEEELEAQLDQVLGEINKQGGTLVSTQVMQVKEDVSRRSGGLIGPPGREDRLVLFVNK